MVAVQSRDKKRNLALTTGIFLILVIVGIVFFFPMPMKEKSFVVRLISALGSGGIAAIIPGFFRFKYQNIISATGGAGFFAFVYLVNPASLGADSFSVSVYVHGERGVQDMVLKNNGSVILDLKGDRRIEAIDSRGMANFREIPSRFLDNLVPITIEADAYQPKNDSLYKLVENDAIYIMVTYKGLSKVRGFVVDENNRFVDNAKVKIESLLFITDSLGRFSFEIPKDEQKRIQHMIVSKSGYETWTGDVTPETNEEVQIKLIKE